MRNLIILAAAVLLYFLVFRWFARQPRKTRFQTLMVIAGVVLVGLAATGRLNWVFAVLGALLPFVLRLLALLNYVPLFHRLYRQFSAATGGRQTTGQQSKVETKFLRLILDHDSGEMSGQVVDGQFQGKTLEQLTLEQLLLLLQECQREDRESAQLLEAYLDRIHGDEWREQTQAAPDTGSSGFSERMTQREAYDILGLETGASHAEIKSAHRRLIQKLHPDRGGSTYLAWKINQAKALLLEEK